MSTFFNTLWERVVNFFASINVFSAVLDIAIVAFLIYTLFKLVRDSRAEQLIKGIIFLVLIQLVATLLNLQALSYVMTLLFDNAIILIAVIFQPELRRALEHAGHSRSLLDRIGWRGADETDAMRTRQMIDAVCGAADILQKQKMGALIVFERDTNLGDIVKTGTVLNAEPTAELIGNVFFNKAPLHDGAMVMRDGLVHAAGCILPLTDNRQMGSDLGTRHRAAVGMSENSDALILVISEETGAISIAQSGVLKRDYTVDTLRTTLENRLIPEALEEKTPFWRRKRK